MFVSLKQAIRGLTANPIRTALTTLGIVIGIATVIIVLSAGQGFNSFINSQLESLGTNTVTVETRIPPTTRNRGGGFDRPGSQSVAITTLKNRDVQDVMRLPNVSNVYGAVIGQKVASYQNVSKNTMIFGADASRFDIDKGIVEKGRPYTDSEDKAAAQVAVLGYQVAQDLFGQDNPVGKTVRIGQYNFVVIGVYEKRGGLNGGDDQIFVPLNTAQKKLLGIDYLFYMLAEMKNKDLSDATAEDMRQVIRTNHSITDSAKDDFDVKTQAGNLSTFNTILSGVTFLLIAVAAISLLVGGVGIMNIMYVVVTERISEIGLKKALGARSGDILAEFLIESILLTVFGGIMGVVFGAGISFGIAKIAQSFGFAWQFSVPISGILIGVGVAGIIGLVFGVFPARRAAKMDPMEALRYE